MANSKAEILERIEREYADLLEALTRMADHVEAEQGDEGGGWSAKDILAHIAAWEHVLLRFHIGGEPFEEVIEMPGARYHVTSFDEINAHLISTYGSWSMSAVEEFAEETHAKLLSKLASLTESEVQAPAESIAAIGLDPFPLYEYIAANTYDHYREHQESARPQMDV